MILNNCIIIPHKVLGPGSWDKYANIDKKHLGKMSLREILWV